MCRGKIPFCAHQGSSHTLPSSCTQLVSGAVQRTSELASLALGLLSPTLMFMLCASQPGPRQKGLLEQCRCKESVPSCFDSAGRLNVGSRGSWLQIWMSVQKDCTTASPEGCCARTSSAPSCASAHQGCSAGPMERAAQVPRTRLGGIPSGAGGHPLLGIVHVALYDVLLSNSSFPGLPMCQNFWDVLLDAYTHKTSVHLWTYGPYTSSTTLCHVSFLLSLSRSVSSFFALSSFWRGQHWTAQTCTVLGTAGMQSEPSSTPSPAAWPLAGGECAKQGSWVLTQSHPALGEVQSRWMCSSAA